MVSTEDLSINKFEYIFVENADSNISDLLRFCGVKEGDLEQEIILHSEGDCFLYSEGNSLDDAKGSYLIKQNDYIFKIDKTSFEAMFKEHKSDNS